MGLGLEHRGCYGQPSPRHDQWGWHIHRPIGVVTCRGQLIGIYDRHRSCLGMLLVEGYGERV